MAIKNNHKRGKKIVKLSCALHKLLIGIYTYNKSLRACLVNCNGNYIEIGISIIRNTRCCNVILIIYLCSDNTRLEL